MAAWPFSEGAKSPQILGERQELVIILKHVMSHHGLLLDSAGKSILTLLTLNADVRSCLILYVTHSQNHLIHFDDKYTDMCSFKLEFLSLFNGR